MDTQQIRFVANRDWLTEDSPSRPCPVGATLPDWYRRANSRVQDVRNGGTVPTWKACPAVEDIMGSGYAYRTPCDIEFSEDGQGVIQARVSDPRFRDFLVERMPLQRFPVPQGFHARHFAWWPDWTVELPDGYSALYTQPLNRFELPFLTMSGIVDNDKVRLPGTMPFFVLKGSNGILPAGTPYAQIFPFRREHWEAEVDTSLTPGTMSARNRESAAFYRQPEGGVYARKVWQRRQYK